MCVYVYIYIYINYIYIYIKRERERERENVQTSRNGTQRATARRGLLGGVLRAQRRREGSGTWVGGKRSHTRNHKSNISLETATGNPVEVSTNISLGK